MIASLIRFDLQWSETLREAEARALAQRYELQRREEARAAAKVAPTAPPSASRRVAFADDADGGGGGGGSGSNSDNAAVSSSSGSVSPLQAPSHTNAAHMIEAIATLRRREREEVHALKQGRCPSGTGRDNDSYVMIISQLHADCH